MCSTNGLFVFLHGLQETYYVRLQLLEFDQASDVQCQWPLCVSPWSAGDILRIRLSCSCLGLQELVVTVLCVSAWSAGLLMRSMPS